MKVKQMFKLICTKVIYKFRAVPKVIGTFLFVH